MKLGISACVLGEKVRFDSGHKRNHFICNELANYVEFVPVCPEVGIGLPIPRPAIRLIDADQNTIRLVDSKTTTIDHTPAMRRFCEQKIKKLESLALCGYVVCAKSPTCGMERVKVYNPSTNMAEKKGVGIFTQILMEKMPWLPVEEDGRLNAPELRENFVFRLFALQDLYNNVTASLSTHAIIAFHSRYKLMLMAHSVKKYQELGRLVGNIANYELHAFYELYRTSFMQAISKPASRKNNTNVLMHLQGYFKMVLDKQQKAELSRLIHGYHQGILPLLVPLTLINHYVSQYPNPYLQDQCFLNPYPEKLRLRYGL